MSYNTGEFKLSQKLSIIFVFKVKSNNIILPIRFESKRKSFEIFLFGAERISLLLLSLHDFFFNLRFFFSREPYHKNILYVHLYFFFNEIYMRLLAFLRTLSIVVPLEEFFLVSSLFNSCRIPLFLFYLFIFWTIRCIIHRSFSIGCSCRIFLVVSSLKYRPLIRCRFFSLLYVIPSHGSATLTYYLQFILYLEILMKFR